MSLELIKISAVNTKPRTEAVKILVFKPSDTGVLVGETIVTQRGADLPSGCIELTPEQIQSKKLFQLNESGEVVEYVSEKRQEQKVELQLSEGRKIFVKIKAMTLGLDVDAATNSAIREIGIDLNNGSLVDARTGMILFRDSLDDSSPQQFKDLLVLALALVDDAIAKSY